MNQTTLSCGNYGVISIRKAEDRCYIHYNYNILDFECNDTKFEGPCGLEMKICKKIR